MPLDEFFNYVRSNTAKPSSIPQGEIARGLWDGFNNNPQNRMAVDRLLTANSFAPITGDIQSGILAANDLRNGDYGSAALNGIGMLPFVPSLGGFIPAVIGATKKQTIPINAIQEIFDSVGVPKGKVFADVDKLHRKHPEHFDSPDAVESHLNYVFGAKPDEVLQATDPRYTLLARNSDEFPVKTGEQFRAAITDFTGNRQGNYWVRSAFPMDDAQVVGKGGVGLPVKDLQFPSESTLPDKTIPPTKIKHNR